MVSQSHRMRTGGFRVPWLVPFILAFVCGATLPRDAALAAELTYDATSLSNPRVLLTDPVDHTVYAAELVPEKDNIGRVLTIDIVLSESNKRVDGANLVEPDGNWHGEQPFMFDAWDLARGPARSEYGQHRSLDILGHKTVLSVDIRDVRLAPRTGPCAGDDCIGLLDLSVAVVDPEKAPIKCSRARCP